jgi:hypothetical protein
MQTHLAPAARAPAVPHAHGALLLILCERQSQTGDMGVTRLSQRNAGDTHAARS